MNTLQVFGGQKDREMSPDFFWMLADFIRYWLRQGTKDLTVHCLDQLCNGKLDQTPGGWLSIQENRQLMAIGIPYIPWCKDSGPDDQTHPDPSRHVCHFWWPRQCQTTPESTILAWAFCSSRGSTAGLDWSLVPKSDNFRDYLEIINDGFKIISFEISDKLVPFINDDHYQIEYDISICMIQLGIDQSWSVQDWHDDDFFGLTWTGSNPAAMMLQ